MDFHEQLADIEHETGSLLSMGQDEAALAVARRAVAQAQDSPGPAHPHTVNLTDHLAGILVRLGDVAEAMHLREETLAHKRHDLGAHPVVATAANQLAEMYREAGRFTQARGLYLEALAIEPHPVVFGNLGLLFAATDALDDAERYIRFCLASDIKELGPDDPDTAVTRDNLASVLTQKAARLDGDAAAKLNREAEQLMRDALRVFRRAEPGDTLLRGLANRLANCLQLRRFDEALTIGAEADVLGTRIAPASPLHLSILLHLSDAYLETGAVDQADATLQRVMDAAPPSATVASATSRRADVFWRQRRFADAAQALEDALVHDARTLTTGVGLESEGNRVSKCRRGWQRVSRLLCLALRDPDIVTPATALRHALRWKNLAADVERMYVAVAGGSDDRVLSDTFQRLRAGQRHMVELALTGPGVEISPYLEEVSEVERQVAMLEGDLASLMADRGGQAALEKNIRQWWDGISVTRVARQLEKDCVMVWYLSVLIEDPGDQGKPHYLAVTLDNAAAVQIIDLGAADEIDALIQPAVEVLTSISREAVLDAGATTMPALSHALTERLLMPVFQHHPDSTSWLLVPDRKLWAVPFEALPLADDQFVIDKHTIAYAHSGRAPLRFGDVAGDFTEPVVLGDPDYTLGQPIQIEDSLIATLPGTRDECRHVAAALGVTAIEGAQAVKSVVTGARSPVVLHLATHGVYDLETAAKLRRFSPMAWRVMSAALSGEDYHNIIAKTESNPMYRSMLIFAGASVFLDGHDLGDAVGNGLLTAAEITLVDLRGTELVVLSACNTLRGDMEGGTVRGLSSAVAQAGARSALLSLWPVPDRKTAELMQHYYADLLGGAGRADALRKAKLALRADNAPPWTWAGFQCLGDPGPLPAVVLERIAARKRQVHGDVLVSS